MSFSGVVHLRTLTWYLGPPSMVVTVPFCHLRCCPGCRSRTRTGSSTLNFLVSALVLDLTHVLMFGDVNASLMRGNC